MLQNDHLGHQRQKKIKLEINFKREIKVETPIWFCALLQDTGYFSDFKNALH